MRIEFAKTLLSLCLVASTTIARADHATDVDLTSAASWCATTARVLRGWRAYAFSEVYVRRTLATAHARLQDLERSLDERDDIASRDRLVDATEVVRRAVVAVDRREAGSLLPLLVDLDRQAAALKPSR